ncbi:MAG: hypothetical protein J6B99_01690 [Oscillospiraceae bacterium]|nr:hypothetical protein [Oscillospiraceae bacterium]
MHAALIVMAAGMGSRYGGDKQVDGVGPNGEFLMNYGIYDAVRAGFDKIIFVIKPDIKALVEKMAGEGFKHLRTADGRPIEVLYAVQDFASIPDFYHVPPQRTSPLGTVHAVLCARELVQEPFCVINADDYYGQGAYRSIYKELQHLPEEGHAAMVGYLLENTVSAYGTVTRGVCRVEKAQLTHVCETRNIGLLPDGTIAAMNEGVPHILEGDTVVSMNFWGFKPSIFPQMEQYFHNFLGNLGDSEKGECLLPDMVGALLNDGALNVSVLQSTDTWFGMTYQEDKPRVAAALRQLHEKGTYPQSLR